MTRMARKTAVPLGDVLQEFIRMNHLSTGINIQRIFSAWEEASGAGPYTLRKFFRDGRLHITVSSSVIRNQLYYQKDLLVEKMNDILLKDRLFTKDDPGAGLVKELILK